MMTVGIEADEISWYATHPENMAPSTGVCKTTHSISRPRPRAPRPSIDRITDVCRRLLHAGAPCSSGATHPLLQGGPGTACI